MFFSVVDVAIFLMSQFATGLFVSVLPQFSVESSGGAYPRLVGILFLMMGLVRLYGGIRITESGTFQLAMASWVVEFVYILVEVLRGQFGLGPHLPGLLACAGMFAWSMAVYRRSVSLGLRRG